MSLVIKNSIVKLAITMALCFGLSFVYVKLNTSEPIVVLRIFFGGTALYTIIQKLIFLSITALLQYVNADSTHFYLRNEEYLSFRYGSARKLFCKIAVTTCLTTFLYVYAVALGGLIGCYLAQSYFGNFILIDMITLCVKALLFFLFLSGVQTLLIVVASESYTFLMMEGLNLLLIFHGLYNKTAYTLMPINLSGADNIRHFGLYFTAIISLTIILLGVVKRKEFINAYHN